jgi:transposase
LSIDLDSRLGRKSPFAQGRGKMERACVGIDVSKDRLDVHVLPEGETFVVAGDGKGLAELVERMGTLGPERIAVEATGGFETVVAAALAGA